MRPCHARDCVFRGKDLGASALFQILRSIVNRFSDSSRCTVRQHQTTKNTISHDNRDYPPSCRPTFGAVYIDPPFMFWRFRLILLVLPMQSPQGLAMFNESHNTSKHFDCKIFGLPLISLDLEPLVFLILFLARCTLTPCF